MLGVKKRYFACSVVYGAVCSVRICHCEGDDESPLITPCHCTGTLHFVHQACLYQWIKSSDTRCCELCKYDFIMETKLKPLCKWEKLQMTTSEKRKILCSVTFHIIAISCVVWSLYVLIDRTAEEIKQGKDNGILEWPFWTKLVVVAIGFTGGLVFMYVQCKVYVQLWRRLKAYNRVIFVQNCPDTSKNTEEKILSINQSNGNKDSVAVPVSQTETNAQRPGILEWPFWTKLVVVAIGFTGGLVFMYVQCKVYVQLWRRLKAYNRVIFVQNCPDTSKNTEEKILSINQSNGNKDSVAVPVSQTETNAQRPGGGAVPEVATV
ncbi:UNVERIFIED_CONTAM: hypothetical protein FKN15_021469 [Acipenser sinensis]